MPPSPEESDLPQVSAQTQENLDIDPSMGGSLSIPNTQKRSNIPSKKQDLSNFDDFAQKMKNLKDQGLDITEIVEIYETVSIIEESTKDKKSDRFWRNTFNGFKILMGVAAFSSGVYFANISSSSIFGAFLMGGGLSAAGISIREVAALITRKKDNSQDSE